MMLGCANFEDGGWSHEPRNVEGLWQLKKARETVLFPRASQKKAALPKP